MTGAAGRLRPDGPEVLSHLEHARDLGFLGTGPVTDHVAHALALAELVPAHAVRGVDLGTGGGVPGLVVALARPEVEFVFVESMARRWRFLKDVVTDLGMSARIQVIGNRAETACRVADMREAFDVVTARSFASPAATAECATGFLRPGGVLVTSEPPDGASARWDNDRLASLGLGPARVERRAGYSFAVVAKESAVEDRWPRRPGIPAKRPIW